MQNFSAYVNCVMLPHTSMLCIVLFDAIVTTACPHFNHAASRFHCHQIYHNGQEDTIGENITAATTTSSLALHNVLFDVTLEMPKRDPATLFLLCHNLHSHSIYRHAACASTATCSSLSPLTRWTIMRV